jgi:predicted phosphodiesterase
MTVRIGLVSDIHGDVHALTDAVRHAEALGCTRFLCAGDLVDYGYFPDETIALLRERAIPTVRGNHDRWAVSGSPRFGFAPDISDGSRTWLAGLPAHLHLAIGATRLAVHHGSPRGDMVGIISADVERWELDEFFGNSERLGATAAAADVLIVGHTHCAMELRYAADDREHLVVNPGALLGEGARGTFGVLTIDAIVSARRDAGSGNAPAGTFQFDAYFSADGAPAPVARRRL